MKNIFEYQKKYSLSEITKILGDELRKQLKKFNGFSNFKVLAISNKIIVRGEDELSAEIYFHDSSTVGDFNTIDIKIINTKSQISNNFLRIKLNDIKYGFREDLKGGHFWTHTNEWYAYVPDFNIILNDIDDYLRIIGVI